MKQNQAREYVKPQIESYDSQELVEALGTAAGGIVSRGVDDTIPDGIPADDV